MSRIMSSSILIAAVVAVGGADLAMLRPSPERILMDTAVEADWTVSPAIERSIQNSWTLPHAELRRLFETDRIGGYCGLAGEYTAQALRAAGYDAFTINVGIPGGALTHVTVIVRSGDGFFLYDPTFGATLERRRRHVDLFDALRGLPHDVVQRDTSTRDWLVHEQDVQPARAKGYALDECRPVDPIASRPTLRCRIAGFDLHAYVRTARAEIDRAGLPADDRVLLALMRRGLFGVGVTQSPETRELFLTRWRAAGLPEH